MKLGDKVLQGKRHRKKIISLNTAIKLKVFAEANYPEDEKFIKRMERQIRCSIKLDVYTNDVVKSYFCGQKTCLVCNSIKLGKFLNKFLDVIQEEKIKYHMVLTVKNPDERNLKELINKMYLFFNRSSIKRNEEYVVLNKKIKMIRSFEATFNKNARTYHIHFHILLAGEDEEEVKRYGELLIEYWLKYFGKATNIKAQYLTPQEKSILENFKYLFKLKDLTEENMYMAYKLLKATENKRLFTAKNIKKKKNLKSWEELKIKDVNDDHTVLDRFHFNGKINNWVNCETGEIFVSGGSGKNRE